MEDVGLQLEFSDPSDSAKFTTALKSANFAGYGLRVATFEEKLNFDAATLLIVLKILGASATALTAFVKFVREISKGLDKPSVTLTKDGRHVEIRADMSDEELS